MQYRMKSEANNWLQGSCSQRLFVCGECHKALLRSGKPLSLSVNLKEAEYDTSRNPQAIA